MYTIYINENKLVLAPTHVIKPLKGSKDAVVGRYKGKKKLLLSYIDMLEKSRRLETVYIHAEDVVGLYNDFKSLYTIVQASGGLIINEFGEYLMIKRKGYWDLPKGKSDPGETKKQTARREVMEETGISNVKIIQKLLTTRHTYKLNSSPRHLKKTYWFLMQAKKQKLIPETRENIEIATWMNSTEIPALEKDSYRSVFDVIAFYEKNLLHF